VPLIFSHKYFLYNGEFMNWEQIEGKWKQFKGTALQRWGKLTNDDLDVIKGKKEVLIGKLQQRYGCAKNEAEAQAKEFAEQCERQEMRH